MRPEPPGVQCSPGDTSSFRIGGSRLAKMMFCHRAGVSISFCEVNNRLMFLAQFTAPSPEADEITSSNEANRPRPPLERVAHTAGRRSLEVQNEPRYPGALDTSPMFQPPCTRHRVGQYPDSWGLCSTPAANCSDTRLPEPAKARSCCPCSATQGLVGPRLSTGLAGFADPLTPLRPEPRPTQYRDRTASLAYR